MFANPTFRHATFPRRHSPAVFTPPPPGRLPSEEDAWPVNGQNPVTYKPLPATAEFRALT